MFEFVRTHSRWLQLGLLVLILPSFVALGVQGYSGFMDGSGAGVATVDGQRITQAEWDAAVREQADRLRSQNPQIDAKLLDSPQARQQALEGLLDQRVLLSAAQKQHLEVADARLKSVFDRDPNLAFLRNADGSVNKAVLAAQGMSSEGFVQRLRQDLTLRQVLSPTQSRGSETAVATQAVMNAYLEQREISLKRVDAAAFKAQVTVSDDEVKAFYALPVTQERWKRPEQAQIEYLVLDAEALKAGVTVSEADLRTFYEQNRSRYSTAEERRARHILVKLAADAKPDEEKAARSKLEGLLAELRKDPKQFADLARKHSQDEGSAANGGDLDFFGREAMVKPFSDAAFALKVGEVSPIVRSEFGFHLIELVAIRGGSARSFEEVRPEIEAQQRTDLARKRFQELSEQFSNMVYEQADALQPVAEKFGLKVQQAELPRQPRPGAQGPLASAKLLELVFAAESLKSKRNTEAVETAPQQMVSARVLKHQPAAAPALDEVRELVRGQLVAERAAALAKADGEKQLAALQKDPESQAWDAPRWVSRAAAQGLPEAAMSALMRADAKKLPAVVGVDLGNAGYLLIRVGKIGAPEATMAKSAAPQFAQAQSAAEAQAYLEALKLSLKAKLLVAAPAASAASQQ
ncbi:peptidyl-prolyl cis-trans isomerase D [Inhella inkyongensis]|uniref:Periplasmic chaperone PpiD n=1 Tax=Inhella inkyongensis TaxID=392593 RepID=A0A840RZC8_9BURK|nr:SurA N-terminal domain-containing protein [Inhella inkyongensis]MBB5204137.1 peptidyl-prolyl cis-trans isomerase D [Inhella inkyongensis]